MAATMTFWKRLFGDAVDNDIATRDYQINDRRFMKLIKSIRVLKQFLFDQSVHFSPDDLLSIDSVKLDNLRYGPLGRIPKNEEWDELDRKLTQLTFYLTPALRTKLRLRQLSGYFTYLPIFFLVLTAIALFVAFRFHDMFDYSKVFPGGRLPEFIAVLLWTFALGGLGACGFLSTSLLSQSAEQSSPQLPQAAQVETKTDITVQSSSAPATTKITTSTTSIDLTDSNLLNTRLAVGMLFSFILGLPFAVDSLRTILDPFFKNSPADLKSFPIILAPFLFGFSTTLVLGVMDRLIQSVRAFFGLQDSR